MSEYGVLMSTQVLRPGAHAPTCPPLLCHWAWTLWNSKTHCNECV